MSSSDIYICPEALDDIKKWGVDHIDAQTCLAIYMSSEDKDLEAWPENWPKHFNGTYECCDMKCGPCSCGAWHHKDEFYLDGGIVKVNRLAGMLGQSLEEMFKDYYV